ncbi:hypothetical protein KFE80_03580 [bacterium SCSIO 12696]|nr:hypothetical protein KFE80_03580 [bacterium SCSIO 12696]
MFRRAETGVQATTNSEALLPEQQSQLFARLTETLPGDRPFSVLDVGPGVADTVTFFADYRCQLHFADLFSDLPAPIPEGEDLTEQQKQNHYQQYFSELLSFLPDTSSIDLILFWDLFNYMNGTAIAGLAMALAPHLHSGTKGHGFVQRDRQKVPPEYSYGVRSATSLLAKPLTRENLPRHCHGQSSLERQLHSLKIDRGVLMLDGRLEFVLRAS